MPKVTCTYLHTNGKGKQLTLRDQPNYVLGGSSTPGKQLLPLRAGFTISALFYHLPSLLDAGLGSPTPALELTGHKYQRWQAMFSCCIDALSLTRSGERHFCKPNPHHNGQRSTEYERASVGRLCSAFPGTATCACRAQHPGTPPVNSGGKSCIGVICHQLAPGHFLLQGKPLIAHLSLLYPIL